MRIPLFKGLSAIGLDLGSHSVKAVQLAGPESSTVLASMSVPRTTPRTPLTAVELQRVREVMDRRGFRGRDVVVAVPSAQLMTAVLELPPRAPGVPIEQIALTEFARVHKADPAGLTLSIWDLPASSRASKAMYAQAVGAKSAELEAHIDLLESVGFNVVAVDDPYSAAARGTQFLSRAETGMTAIVDLGWESGALTLASKDSVVYTRKLSDAGLETMCRQAVASTSEALEEVEQLVFRSGLLSNTDTSDDGDILDILTAAVDEMLKEIDQAIGYTVHQYPDTAIKQTLLIGGGAAVPGMAQRFEQELRLPAISANDLDQAKSSGLTAGMMTALGLTVAGRQLR